MPFVDIHPLIHGLVDWLPPAGADMSATRRDDWLDCAASILRLLYPEPIESTAALTEVRDNSTEDGPGKPSLDPVAAITPPAGEAPPVDTHSAANPAADTGGSKPAPMAEVNPAASADISPERAHEVLSDEGEAKAGRSSSPDADEPTLGSKSAVHDKEAQTGPSTTITADQSCDEGDDGHTVEADREAGASPALRPATTGKPAGPSGSAAPTLAVRLRALNAEHPEFTVQQAADALGETFERVRNNSNVNKIKWGRVIDRAIGLQDRVAELHMQHRDWSDEEIAAEIGKSNGYVRATARRLGFILPSRKRGAEHPDEPVEAAPPVPAPEPPPKAERPAAPARAPVAAQPSGSGSAVITKPMQRTPKGTLFYLRNDAGLYLHYSCTLLTADKRYAWKGTAEQLLGCRKTFELARDLSEQIVPKEQRAVA